MRKQLTKLALAAAFVLAVVFTFGCLEEKGGGNAQGGCPNAMTSDNTVYCGGQVYRTVKIGTQTWMAKNLNYDVPGNGTDVCYGNVAANCAKYGRLYNWATAMALPLKCNNVLPADDKDCAVKTPHHQGICPAGWHVPSNADLLFANITAENLDKLKTKSGWSNYDPCAGAEPPCNMKMRSGNGTDDFGFAALPGGCGLFDGSFRLVGLYALWWSASADSYDAASWWGIGFHNEDPFWDQNKNNLFSIRCVKD